MAKNDAKPLKSALKGYKKSAKVTAPAVVETKVEKKTLPISTSISTKASSTLPTQFRIIVGSYEHNLLCLSLILHKSQPVFQPIFHFEAHSLSIKSIDLAKRYLVTGSNDEHIRIYDLQKRKELGTLLDHQGTVTTLKFSEEESHKNPESSEKTGKWLLSGSEDGKIIIWRTKDWEPFGVLKGHQGRVNDVAIHPSGRVAISVSKDQTIRLWNLMTAKKAAILKIKGKDHLGQSGEFVRWTHDGKYFVVALLNQILVYKTDDAKIFKKIKFNSSVMCIEFITINGKQWCVLGHGNGKICFYDVESQITVKSPEREGEDEDKIWETKAETIEPEFTLHGHTNRIKDISFFQHPIATAGVPYLISVSSDGKIVVWDVSDSARDQVAVYDTGERLNCVVACPEQVEKLESMKRRYEETEINDDVASESEYETDGEEIKSIMQGKHLKKKGKKGKKSSKKSKVSVTLE